MGTRPGGGAIGTRPGGGTIGDKARWRTRLTLCDYVFLCISACKTYVCTCVCVYALAWSCHSLVVQRGGCPLLGSGGQ